MFLELCKNQSGLGEKAERNCTKCPPSSSLLQPRSNTLKEVSRDTPTGLGALLHVSSTLCSGGPWGCLPHTTGNSMNEQRLCACSSSSPCSAQWTCSTGRVGGRTDVGCSAMNGGRSLTAQILYSSFPNFLPRTHFIILKTALMWAGICKINSYFFSKM